MCRESRQETRVVWERALLPSKTQGDGAAPYQAIGRISVLYSRCDVLTMLAALLILRQRHFAFFIAGLVLQLCVRCLCLVVAISVGSSIRFALSIRLALSTLSLHSRSLYTSLLGEHCRYIYPLCGPSRHFLDLIASARCGQTQVSFIVRRRHCWAERHQSQPAVLYSALVRTLAPLRPDR